MKLVRVILGKSVQLLVLWVLNGYIGLYEDDLKQKQTHLYRIAF